jgi:putative transposase
LLEILTEWGDFGRHGRRKAEAVILPEAGNPEASRVSKYLFETIEQVQDYATEWLWFYNHERPDKANNGKPPLMAA